MFWKKAEIFYQNISIKAHQKNCLVRFQYRSTIFIPFTIKKKNEKKKKNLIPEKLKYIPPINPLRILFLFHPPTKHKRDKSIRSKQATKRKKNRIETQITMTFQSGSHSHI